MSRRPRRGPLLGWTALLWVPLLAVGIALLVVYGSGARAVQDYREGRPQEAADRFGSLSGVLIERWKAPFGEGVSLLAADGSPQLALFQLDRALRLAPDTSRCDVQTTRAVALTRIADDLHAQAVEHATWTVELQQVEQGLVPAPADPPWGAATLTEVIAAGTDLAQQAADRYGEAATALEEPTCPDQQDDQQQQEQQDRADDLRDRQQESQDLGDQMDPSTPEEDSGDGSQTPEDEQAQEEEQRQQELQERNQQAEEEAGLSGGGSGAEGDGEGSGDGGLPW